MIKFYYLSTYRNPLFIYMSLHVCGMSFGFRIVIFQFCQIRQDVLFLINAKLLLIECLDFTSLLNESFMFLIEFLKACFVFLSTSFPFFIGYMMMVVFDYVQLDFLSNFFIRHNWFICLQWTSLHCNVINYKTS